MRKWLEPGETGWVRVYVDERKVPDEADALAAAKRIVEAHECEPTGEHRIYRVTFERWLVDLQATRAAPFQSEALTL